MDFLANNCDGTGPHAGPLPREVRLYPLGGGANLILCRACFARENAFRSERARDTGRPQDWPRVEYETAELYSRQSQE